MAAVLAIGGACGGGDGGGSDSQEAFVEKADPICKATSDRLDATAAIAAADQGAAVVEALPAVEALVADLKAIPPPNDAETAAIMAAYESAFAHFREIAVARENGDAVTEQRLLNELQAQSDAFEQQAKAYGFKECGQG